MSKIGIEGLKGSYLKAYKALAKIGCPVFVRSDQPKIFMISAEDGGSGPDGFPWADCYGQHGAFGVNPAIDAILSKNGLFAEWENPGGLAVYPV